MEKQFILGVGCQKGGTTWIYDQLSKLEQVDFGFKKEYHVFDTLYIEHEKKFRKQKTKRLVRNLKKGNLDTDSLLDVMFLSDQKYYYNYFDELWNSSPNTTTVGDITPSYSGLDCTTLRSIRENLVSRGFAIKLIFLMRDPLERIWSACRMTARNNKSIKIISDNEMVLKRYKKASMIDRTSYDKTIQNLESVFDQSEIFYCLYEQLFSLESLQSLSKFLNLPCHDFDLKSFSNVSKKSQEIDESTAMLVTNFYRQTYLNLIDRFPVKENWKSFKYLK